MLRIPEFLDNRHINVVRLSALRTGRLYLQEISLVPFSVRDWFDPSAMVWTGGLSKWNIPVTPSGTEPTTFRLVAQCYFSLYRLNFECKVNNQLGITIYVSIYACAFVCVCVYVCVGLQNWSRSDISNILHAHRLMLCSNYTPPTLTLEDLCILSDIVLMCFVWSAR